MRQRNADPPSGMVENRGFALWDLVDSHLSIGDLRCSLGSALEGGGEVTRGETLALSPPRPPPPAPDLLGIYNPAGRSLGSPCCTLTGLLEFEACHFLAIERWGEGTPYPPGLVVTGHPGLWCLGETHCRGESRGEPGLAL